ncbi:MAG: Bug family tripartite tricarboxylate transporter substrate binding protein [Pseudomonadota bacterium]|jgi:tripartite-type tricarboxylate transporter receptor subunit TctC
MKHWPRCALVAGLALAAGLPAFAAAAQFPERSLRFIVPFPPGGGTDGFARVLGGKLHEILGQPVIIDNRAGAQGSIGTALGARAAPDGHTLTVGHSGSLVINPHLYAQTGYDTLRDFAPVSGGVSMPFALAVHPSVPAATARELAGYAKANPGKLTFASSSSGPWIAGELFRLTTGTNMVHVPYKGGAPATAALLGGEVSVMFTVPFTTVPQVKAGRLRVLMVLARSRIEALPEVPTAVEAGYPELANVSEWYGVVVPSGTPRTTIVRLNAAVVQALQSADVQKRLAELGLTAAPSTAEAFGQMIREEYLRWGKVVKASGAKLLE